MTAALSRRYDARTTQVSVAKPMMQPVYAEEEKSKLSEFLFFETSWRLIPALLSQFAPGLGLSRLPKAEVGVRNGASSA